MSEPIPACQYNPTPLNTSDEVFQTSPNVQSPSETLQIFEDRKSLIYTQLTSGFEMDGIEELERSLHRILEESRQQRERGSCLFCGPGYTPPRNPSQGQSATPPSPQSSTSRRRR